MANVPISSLPSASSVSSTDLVPLVHNNTTVGATVQQILDALERRGTVTLTFGADGTATQPVSFSSAFGSAISGVTFDIFNYTGTDSPYVALTKRILGTPSLTGFTPLIGGGDPGATCQIFYRANGS